MISQMRIVITIFKIVATAPIKFARTNITLLLNHQDTNYAKIRNPKLEIRKNDSIPNV